MDSSFALNLLQQATFLTYHSMSLIPQQELAKFFCEQRDDIPKHLPYPAQAFYLRLNHRMDGKQKMAPFWSEETLFNLLANEESFMEDAKEQIIQSYITSQDLVKREQLNKMEDLDILKLIFGHPTTSKEIIESYYGYPPIREDILRKLYYILESGPMMNVSFHTEETSNSLLNGVFFARGYQRGYYEKKEKVNGNLHLLSSEDFHFLLKLYGLPKTSSTEQLIREVINEQNTNIEDLVEANLLYEVDGYSVVEGILQTLQD